MSYPSDLTDERWALLQPVFNPSGNSGRNRHWQPVRSRPVAERW